MDDVQPEARDSPSAVVRLEDCLKVMGTELVHANPSPENLRHVVFDVLVNDPLDEWANVENRIIVAVGLTCGSVEFDQLLNRAADGQAAAVIVKARAVPLERLRSTAERYDLALLVAPDTADWTRVVALARASVEGAAVDSISGARLGDLYAFANAAASITNGAASIVDPLGRVLGYSTLPGQAIDELRRVTTLALQEIKPPANDDDFKTVYSAAGAVVILATDGGMDRLALAVRAGGELLGSIWVIDPGVAKRDAALEALDKMAPLIGLHMLHARSESDFGERRSGDLIRTLMQDPGHAPFAAAQLGLESANGLAVAAFSIVRPESGSLDSVREVQRLLHMVTAMCKLNFTGSHTAMIDSVVFALLPCNGLTPRSLHRRFVQEVSANAHAISDYPFIGAVGGIASRIQDLPDSRAEALQTLDYLRHRHSAPEDPEGTHIRAVALFEDHRVPLSLLKIAEFMTHNNLGEGDEIEEIQVHDANNGTEFLNTLATYLTTNGNISAMAARLQIHNNTARYRVGRLIDHFHLDLDDPQLRLWLWLRLETLGLSQEGGA